jgi:hypothetical protein
LAKTKIVQSKILFWKPHLAHKELMWAFFYWCTLGLKQKFSYFRKNFTQKSLWKFSIRNADPDAGANSMCMQIRNTCKCYIKIIWKISFLAVGFQNTKIKAKTWAKRKTFTKTKTFREKLNFSCKQKLFAKTFSGTKIFAKAKFSQNKILRKACKFSLNFAFCKNEKPYCTYTFIKGGLKK